MYKLLWSLHSLTGGRGNWTTEGCVTTIAVLDDDGSTVINCLCNHLTNFACLVVRIMTQKTLSKCHGYAVHFLFIFLHIQDICSRSEGCEEPSKEEALALEVLSIIGVILSMIGLVLTVITLLVFK